MTDAIAIIPARGGSKGIPAKNLRRLGTETLIGRAIKSALKAKTINRVFVSTDDEEIADVSRQAGAEVIRRPVEISGDRASSEAALLHVLDHLENTLEYVPDLTVFIQCTSPLTLPEDIDATVESLLSEDADCSLAVTPFHHFLWRRLPKGCEGINHESSVRQMRQDREPEYLETGAVYAMRTDGFRKAGHRFFGKVAMSIIPQRRCFEIDEPDDLLIGEALLNARTRSSRLTLPDPLGALVLDFDGVFTDNRAIVHQDGTESVVVSRSDGMWLSRLMRTGLPVFVLSSEVNPVVATRCNKLGVECISGVGDKGAVLREWLDERDIAASTIVYVGNADNDRACLEMAGLAVVVADAEPEAIDCADYILASTGGNGAVAEISRAIINRERNR
ncbi:MAG: acylneuraminate cytidylyltransferase [Deltaproteobacteria bacterium]|nr:acylneuraminate cytidylyltransferase [Deltaproteobacteria bacterium]